MTYLFGFFVMCLIFKNSDLNTLFTVYNVLLGIIGGLLLGKLMIRR